MRIAPRIDMSRFAGVLLLILAGTAFAEAPPASGPEAPTPPAAAPAPARAKIPLRVVRILPDASQAILFDRTRKRHVLVEVGDRVAGFVVEAIDDEEVTLMGEAGLRAVLAGPETSHAEAVAAGNAPQPSSPAPITAVPSTSVSAEAPVTGEPATADSDAPAAPMAAPAPLPASTAPTTGPAAAAPPAMGPAAGPVPLPAHTAPTTAAPLPASTGPGAAPAVTPTTVVQLPANAAPTAGPATAPIAGPPAPSTPAVTAPPVIGPPVAPVDPYDQAASETRTAEPAPGTLAPSKPADAKPLPAESRIALSRQDFDAALADFGALTAALQGTFTASGVRLDVVDPASLFARVGLRAGDLITAVNGRPLRSLDDAADLYASSPGAKAVTVQVVRGGKPATLHIAIR